MGLGGLGCSVPWCSFFRIFREFFLSKISIFLFTHAHIKKSASARPVLCWMLLIRFRFNQSHHPLLLYCNCTTFWKIHIPICVCSFLSCDRITMFSPQCMYYYYIVLTIKVGTLHTIANLLFACFDK